MIVKTLLEHITMVILHFGVKDVVLEQNSFISQNKRSFTETAVIGTYNILLKFELDQIIFLDFKSLKYKEIRVSGAKLFRSVFHVQNLNSLHTYRVAFRRSFCNNSSC